MLFGMLSIHAAYPAFVCTWDRRSERNETLKEWDAGVSRMRGGYREKVSFLCDVCSFHG